jgi:hypothetical protein
MAQSFLPKWQLINLPYALPLLTNVENKWAAAIRGSWQFGAFSTHLLTDRHNP